MQTHCPHCHKPRFFSSDIGIYTIATDRGISHGLKMGYWLSFPAINNSRSLITISQTSTFKMSSNYKRGSGDGGPPPKRLGAPDLPPNPPDPLKIAMAARERANIPKLQCLLQFMNRDPGTLCYAGSGCNLLCCAPTMTRFLGQLPPSQGLPNMVRQLALRAPNMVRMFFNYLI